MHNESIPIEAVFLGALAMISLFIVLPALIFHHVSKWRATSRLTEEDETMLDELYDLARRLDERMATIERIMTDEHPEWNALASERAALLSARREVGQPRGGLGIGETDFAASGRA